MAGACVTGCDFDTPDDLCGWENLAKEDIQWELWTGQGDSPGVGPEDDFSKPGCDFSESSSPGCFSSSEIFTQCDFNNNTNPFCGWVSSGDNGVTWTRTNQSTPTEETGPPGDYPHGGQSIRLTSQAFCTDTEACVEFYYYMYGIVEVQTQLRVLVEGSSGMAVPLWTRTGIQSPTWLLGSVTVPYGGYYIYPEAGKSVQLESPALDSGATEICVEFLYYLYSLGDKAQLAVKVQDPSGNISTLWTRGGMQSSAWLVGAVTVQSPDLRPFKESQTTSGTPGRTTPVSHTTSVAASTTTDSKTSTIGTTASHSNTTTTAIPTASSTSHTQPPITSPASSSQASTTTGHTSLVVSTFTTSPLTTVGSHTTPAHSQTSTTPHGMSTTTRSTSLAPTSTIRTTASHANTTVAPSPSLSTGHTQLPITSPASSSQPSTTTGHTSLAMSTFTTSPLTTMDSHTTPGHSQTSTTPHGTSATTSSTSLAPTSTTRTTATHANTTVATSPSLSTGHTQLPITSPTSGSQPSTTTGHTSSVTTTGYSSSGHPSSTTTGHTSLPVSSFTTSPLTQYPSTTAGATSHVTTATYTSHHPSSTIPVHPGPNISTTAGHPGPSSLSTTSPTSGSPTPSHANPTTPSTITTRPLTTPGHVSSSPATTSSSRTTTSGTTPQASPTFTSPSSTAATIHITSAHTEPPGTSTTTTSLGTSTSRHPSPTITGTTVHGTSPTTVPLLTSSTTSTTQVHVSPTTQHSTTVGHVNITSTIKTTTTTSGEIPATSTKPTSTTPGGGQVSPTTVGHTSPSTSQATAMTTTVTPATSPDNITTTSQASPATSTPQIRTTTPTPHTTSHIATESRETTVTITEKSSTKMPVGPEATTTAAALQTTTANPSPTLGVSTVTTATTTTPVAPQDQVICTISGDPHYTTYDGRLFHFMGTCTYLLSALCNATAGLPTFKVQATNEHRGANKQVSYVKSVSVEVYETQIVLLKARRVTCLFLQLFSWFSGNYNGQVMDDNLMPNGTSAGTNADKLGESWQVPDAGDAGCSNTGDPGECDKDIAAEAEKPTSCGILTDPQGPFAPCHSKVPPEGAFENCVYDLCGTGGDAGTLCFALQAYADRCAQAGITITWRNSSFCPLNCPSGSSYTPCGPACPATCPDAPSQDSCSSLPCVEGCVCDEGRVLSGDQCVPIDQCGCTDTSGQYHPVRHLGNRRPAVGESWMGNSECTQRCTCGALNSITCEEWSCSPFQECQPLEGLLGCQDTVSVFLQVCQPDDREDLEPSCSPAEMERLHALCLEIWQPKYQPCHGIIDPRPFVQNCLFDMCEYQGMASVLCDIIQSYVEACKSQGVTDLSWRNSTFCPLPCPPHSHYTECASPCPATCCNLYAPASCQSRTTCVEGCTCDRGYVLSDDSCVSMRDCGCLDSQYEYHSPGDTWVTTDCRHHCTCNGNGNITCQTFNCLPGSLCTLSSTGLRYCRPTSRSTYTLTQTLGDLPASLIPFSVAGRNLRRFPLHRFSFLREVDGLAVIPPYSTQDGGLQITQSGRRLLLQTDFGLSVSFDGRDFAAWMREEPSDEVETGFEINCSPEQLMFVNGTDACGALSDPQGPFTACHSILSPDTFQETLVPRLRGLCPVVSCPPHTTYQSCMTACPASCANMAAPSDCEAPCVEGCASDPGYVLSGLDSVPYNQCGCTSNDQYYQINDTFWTDNCSQLCTCRNTGTLECQAGGCASGEICTLANYTLGCFRATACLSSPCKNEGTCQDTSEGFLCLCLEGYTGPLCEEAQADESPTAALPLETSTVPPTSPPSENNQLMAILLGVFIPLGIIVIVVGIICFCRQRNRRKMKDDRVAVLSVAGQTNASAPFSERITPF
ncbi:hypothetical protein JD844_000749 [Phrynosoma platyrhinos]|uniref:Zonadhesin n=1 Tax=Phrynosoma platyrhinos TaxID=52577 RepID=A0ABQ7T9D2_PHRPL|nr:hypothetical protein JD844_000749 [Phrynosoma platyrhinos]